MLVTVPLEATLAVPVEAVSVVYAMSAVAAVVF